MNMYDKMGIMGGSWWWSVDLCACTIPSIDTDRRIRNYAVTTSISALLSTLPPNYVLLLCHFLPFSDHGLPDTWLSTRFGFYEVGMWYLRPTPNQEGEGISLYPVPRSDPVRRGSYQELACLRPSFRVHLCALCANVPSKRWEIPLRETPTTLPRIAQD
jgi:hypothetical protein